MIKFKKVRLSNGLTLIMHQDKSTPMVGVNIAYNVGAKNEDKDHTGFAHLFEHLMFGGSVNIPEYDTPVQIAGGSNNAFTTCDMTNYYVSVPKNNLEVALWLESDRMLSLAFSQESLDVQRQVVCEEFRQNYINQPYGDIWHLLRPMAYKTHPYQWPTIGRDIKHIENATLDQVKDFFYGYYAPNNAVLVIAGDIDFDKTYTIVDKWFGDIESRVLKHSAIPQEKIQTEKRELTVYRDIPLDTYMYAWHMGARNSLDYICGDLLSDILSNGDSSRLYQNLVKRDQIFLDIDAFITGENDPGLFSVIGKVVPGVSQDVAHHAIMDELSHVIQEKITDHELAKVVNKYEANLIYSETNYLDKAMSLANWEITSEAEDVNTQLDKYASVTKDQIQHFAQKTFQESNCSVLNYLAKANHDN